MLSMAACDRAAPPPEAVKEAETMNKALSYPETRSGKSWNPSRQLPPAK